MDETSWKVTGNHAYPVSIGETEGLKALFSGPENVPDGHCLDHCDRRSITDVGDRERPN